MDFSLSKESIRNIVNVCDTTVSQSIDSDITLPEYTDNIDCVLSCSLTPQIDSAVFSDGRVTVEGRAVIRLLYSSEKGTLNCFESEVPFSRFSEMQNVRDTDCISVRAETQYVNCRLVNPRRFDAHGSITICLEASALRTEQTVSDASGAGIQVRGKKLTVSNALAVKEKQFSLSEVLEISDSLAPMAQIVNITASPRADETKLISGKALVKGDMDLEVFYIPDSESSAIEKASFSLPISQIIELDNAEEGDFCVTKINVCATNCALRADSGGNIRLIDASVIARAKVSVFRTEEIQIVCDAFSTGYETENEIKRLEIKSLKEQFCDVCLCRSPFSSSGKEIRNVLSLVTGDISSSCSVRDGKLFITGSVRTGLTVEYSNGEKGYIEKPLEFEYSRNIECGEIICEKSVRVNASSFLLTSQSNVDVRVETEITGWIFESRCISAVTDIRIKEDCPKAPCPVALTLYYPDTNEAVWDIAKRYNTTERLIREENNLSDETVCPGAALILPRM